jgi:uncharacterized protein
VYKFEVYKDKKGEWRWRFKASNGDILADSGEGYKNKSDCEAGIESVRHNGPGATIVVL